MTRTEVENVINVYYPKYWRSRFVDHERTNRFGDTIVETSMYKNRWVQYVYDKDDNVKSLIVMVQWTYGLNRINEKEAKTIDEFKKALGL